LSNSRARPTVDLDAPGLRRGHFVLPWSRDDSAWGALRIPFLVANGGSGPRVLVCGGNHGDEFEGPLAITRLASRLQLADVGGRLILVPFLNYPAVRAGSRTSPIDGGNMNRSFVGRRLGTLTEQFAYFVQHELVSRADAVIDLHSGGRSMQFVPFAGYHVRDGAPGESLSRELAAAFAAPIALAMTELDDEGMLDSAVEGAGKAFLTTEIGGGGSTDASSVRLADDGLCRALRHLHVLRTGDPPPAAPPRWLRNDDRGYVSAEADGLLEYHVLLGAEVRAGQLLATIHDFDSFTLVRHQVCAPIDGVFLGRRHDGLARNGDFLALIAQELA
jgi:N-alpha-acetyl-L-2,4-diaminobutyrate deacetylase